MKLRRMQEVEGSPFLNRADVLIFSSHKTATQTIRHSLQACGVSAVHAHLPENIGLTEDSLPAAVMDWQRQRDQPLTVLSVFREPMARLMSSFFQSLQVHYFARTKTLSEEENQALIPRTFDRGDDELRQLFTRYIDLIDGFGESLDVLARVWKIDPLQFNFDPDQGVGVCTAPGVRLFTFRFDQILPDAGIVGRALQTPALKQWTEANVTAQKPHRAVYEQFRQRARVAPDQIRRLYERRRHLLEVFYPGAYQEMLDAQLASFAST